jgi:hypothetical protein
VRREVGFAGVELAPFAGAYDFASVSNRGGLVEALAERIAYEGAGRGMVAADTRVYVPEELASVHPGDVFVAPVRLVRGWLDVHGFGLVAPYPSRRERTYASFEGSASMGSVPAGFEGAPEGSTWLVGCGSRATDG